MNDRDIQRLSEKTKQALLASLPEELSKDEANQLLTDTFTEVLGHDLNVKVVANRPRIQDRLEYVSTLQDINILRKALRAAYAKRCKAQTEEQDYRYGEELQAIQKRMKELNTKIDESEDPLECARSFGETDEGLVQRLLDQYSDINLRYTRWLKYLKMTKLQAKDFLEQIPMDQLPKEILPKLASIGPEARTIYLSRALRRDQRVIHLNKVLCFIELYTPEYLKSHYIRPIDGRGSFKKAQAAKAAKAAKKAETLPKQNKRRR